MILLLTNRQDITADFVVLELRKRKANFFRFNTEDFPQKVKVRTTFRSGEIEGYLYPPENKIIPFSSIKSVWYRRPVSPELDKKIGKKERKFCIEESQRTLDGIWNNLKCFWVSEPQNIHYAENKLTQLRVASELGFKVPKTIISNSPKEIRKFYDECNRDIIIKPVKSGLIRDDLVVFTNKVIFNDVNDFDSTEYIPSIYQENIPKQFDIRITVIGNKVFPVEIHSQKTKDSLYDWRKSQDLNMLQKRHSLPKLVEKKCIELLNRFKLKFGAIDMILTPEGNYYFLEINPNGQWAWIEKRTGYKLTKTLVDLLIKGRL